VILHPGCCRSEQSLDADIRYFSTRGSHVGANESTVSMEFLPTSTTNCDGRIRFVGSIGCRLIRHVGRKTAWYNYTEFRQQLEKFFSMLATPII